jgi:hypothetical protein
VVSSTNKTDRHDITEILLKVALSTIPPYQETIRVKFEVNVKIEAEEAVSVISFTSSSLVYINEIQIAKFGSLIDTTTVPFMEFIFHNSRLQSVFGNFKTAPSSEC